MPVTRCSNGKYRIGSGPCMYKTKAAAERAERAYFASLEKCGCGCGSQRTAIETRAQGALLAVNGAVSWGGEDVAAVASMAPGHAVSGPAVMLVGEGGDLRYRARNGTVESLRSEARKIATHEGVPVALATVIKSDSSGEDLLSVLRADYLYEPHDLDLLLDAADLVTPEILYHLAPVQKELDPLDARAVDRIVANIANYMSRKWGQVSHQVFDRWINDLINRNWGDATDAELELVTRRLNQSFREAGGKHWNEIRTQLFIRNERSAQGVRTALVKRYDFSVATSLSLKDIGAIRQVTASQANYVTDAAGNIAVQASQQARQIVKSGVAQGLSNREIGRDLQKALGKTLTGRSRHYFDVAANAMVVRSQSYSKLITMQEAGVEKAIWSSVLDEVTTPTCRWADGKVWNVELLLAQSARTAANTDPRNVRFTQPWIRERNIKGGEFDGKRGLFVRQRDGSDTLIAAELESGFGEIDNRGRWHEAMDQETLQDMGIGQPPLHGRCRSQLVPDMIQPKTRTRRVTVPDPKPRPPIIDPRGNLPRVPTSTANTGLAAYEVARVAQAKEQVDAGRMPRKRSKYDKVINSSNKSAVAPIFSGPTGLVIQDARSLAARRIKQILLAAAVAAAARIREVRLSSKIKPKDALSKVDYKESTRVLTLSKEAAEDTTEGGKQVTGKQLAYALELERRRAKRKDGKATPADRAAARQADLTNSTGTLFDARALEDVP